MFMLEHPTALTALLGRTSAGTRVRRVRSFSHCRRGSCSLTLPLVLLVDIDCCRLLINPPAQSSLSARLARRKKTHVALGTALHVIARHQLAHTAPPATLSGLRLRLRLRLPLADDLPELRRWRKAGICFGHCGNDGNCSMKGPALARGLGLQFVLGRLHP